jgi:hypothetical protein
MSTRSLALAAIALSSLSATVAAQQPTKIEFDVATVTCAQVSQMAPAYAVALLNWMDGYLGGKANDTMYDSDRAAANYNEVVRVCKEEPGRSVLSIMQKFEELQSAK